MTRSSRSVSRDKFYVSRKDKRFKVGDPEPGCRAARRMTRSTPYAVSKESTVKPHIAMSKFNPAQDFWGEQDRTPVRTVYARVITSASVLLLITQSP